MNRSVYLSVLAGIFLIMGVPVKAGPDLEREQRLASEIVDSIIDGEPVMLEADGTEFLGIYAETDADKPRGAILVLHGRGYHPNWMDVVYPVRTGMLEHGWNTLSVQLPVLDKEATYNDYLPLFDPSVGRINAAIEFLKEQGNDFIVLVAHSCGTHMANRWIEKTGGAGVSAVVMIGMGATDKGQPMQDEFHLDELQVPVLDIMALGDFPAVRGYAPIRLVQIKSASLPMSRQRVIPDANHYFTNRGDALVEVIADWLDDNWPAE